MRASTITLSLGLLLCGACTAIDKFNFVFVDGGGAMVDLAGDGATSGCGTGPACAASECCVAGKCLPTGANTSANQLCVDGHSVPCGMQNTFCCQGQSCAGGCCSGSFCVGSAMTCGPNGTCSGAGAGASCGGCGGSSQACCDGTPNIPGTGAAYCVASGLACNPDSMKCEPCGGASQTCCEGNLCNGGGCCDHSGNAPTCIAAGAGCPGGLGTCVNGGCKGGTCGVGGSACCANQVDCTAPLTTCQGGSCVACGAVGQPCCADRTQLNTGFCGTSLVCDLGTCRRCGEAGQRCCAGGVCNPNANPKLTCGTLGSCAP